MLFFSFELHAQEKLTLPRKDQIIIRLDNDAFAPGRLDRYYSAGHYLDFYHFLGKGKSLSLGFGNQIFTPDLRKELGPASIDRPFAGLNYLQLGFQIRKSRWFYEGNLLGGHIGPGSGVSQFHNWYHNKFGFKRAQGWENQVQNAFIWNVELQSMYSLLDLGPMEVLIEGSARTGNLEQSLNFKPSIRIGTFEKLANSQINGSRVGTSRSQEQYFHFGVELKQVFFNHSLDGELISPKIPPPFESEQGVAEIFGEFILNYNHFGMGYGLFYRTKENESASNQVFARITLSWLF